ncbi:FtsB family cell division protein [Maribellus mangrovi]|uniref:FtsB family cell division protein n=1 Tax=Maribellus mangrovi TaxID=3133146 RepID=UPI0030ED06C0
MKKDFLNSSTFKFLGNKFFIASVVFAAFILFFDENSISRHLKDRRKLSDLKEQKAYYKERIVIDKQKYRELNRGDAELEKFAREQYYMSKPDEDVFIIEEIED